MTCGLNSAIQQETFSGGNTCLDNFNINPDFSLWTFSRAPTFLFVVQMVRISSKQFLPFLLWITWLSTLKCNLFCAWVEWFSSILQQNKMWSKLQLDVFRGMSARLTCTSNFWHSVLHGVPRFLTFGQLHESSDHFHLLSISLFLLLLTPMLISFPLRSRQCPHFTPYLLSSHVFPSNVLFFYNPPPPVFLSCALLLPALLSLGC